MDCQGKSWISENLVQEILNMFASKSENIIISLLWDDMKSNTAIINYDKQQAQIHEDNNSVTGCIEDVPLNHPLEQEHSCPNRKKKPVNKNENFLWHY
jgi:hypothetical protein